VSVADHRDRHEIFRFGNMLCWSDRLLPARSGRPKYQPHDAAGSMTKILRMLVLCSWSAIANAHSNGVELVNALKNAPSAVVFSLAPMSSRGARISLNECADSCFQSWQTLGRVSISGIEATKVSKNLIKWVQQPLPKALAACFSPRHGARIASNGHVYDFVLCFECGTGKVYKDGGETAYAELYSPGQRELWNQLLDTAKIQREIPYRE
jgi:hypothetical protein